MKRGGGHADDGVTSPKKPKEDQPCAGVLPVHQQQQQQHVSRGNLVHPLFEREKGAECPGPDVVAAVESVLNRKESEEKVDEKTGEKKLNEEEEFKANENEAVAVIARFLNKLRSVPCAEFSPVSKQPQQQQQQQQYNSFDSNKHIYTGLAVVAKTHPGLFMNEELLGGMAWLMSSAGTSSSGASSSSSGQSQNTVVIQVFAANVYHMLYRRAREEHKGEFFGLDPLLVKAFYYDYFYGHQWSEDKRADGFKDDVMHSVGNDFFTKLSPEEQGLPANDALWLPPFEYRKRVGALLSPMFEEFFQKLDAFTHMKAYKNAAEIVLSALSLPQVCALALKAAEGWAENTLLGPAAPEIVKRIIYFVSRKGVSEDELMFFREAVWHLSFYRQKNDHVLGCLRGILRAVPGMSSFALKELMFGVCLRHMAFSPKAFHIIYETGPKDENGKLATDQLICQYLFELAETSIASKFNICELLKVMVNSFVKSSGKLFDIIGCAKRCLSFATNGNSGGGVASDSEKLKVTVKVDNVVHLCCFSIILGFILVKTKAEKPSSGGLNSSSGNGNGGGSSVNLARYLAFARDTQCCALSWLVQILPQWSKDKKVMIKYMRQVLMLVKPEIIDGNALTDSEKKVGLVIFDKKSPTAFPVSEQLLSAIAVLIRECSSTPSALSENFRILESVALRGLESLGPESKAVLPPVFSDPQGLVQELFSLARVREHGEFYDADTVWSCAVLMVVLAAIDTGSFGWYVWENVPSVAVLMEMILTDNWGGRPLVSRHAVGPSEAELEAADRAERTRLPAEVTAERTLILFDPQQQRSRPTDEAVKNVENIVARHPLVKGRLLGKKEFFEGILEGQSMEGLMLWLPELIHKDGEMAAALPSKLLCELLLSPLFCDPERTHCVRRVQAWAGSKDQAQQAESVEVFMFFLRCLGSPHCHMREHARAALMEIFGSLEGVVRAEVLTSSAQRLLDACMRIADAIGVETRPEVIAKYIELLAECRSVFPVQDTLHRFCLTLASRPLLRKVLLDNDENEEGSALLQRTAEALITLCFKSCGSMVSTEALAGISLFFGVSKRPHTDALDPGILENLFGERGWLSIFSVRDLVLMWAESEDPVVCAAGVSRLEHEDLVSLICTPGYTKQTVSLAVETLAKSGPLQKAVYANVAHCLELYGLGDMVKMLAKEDD